MTPHAARERRKSAIAAAAIALLAGCAAWQPTLPPAQPATHSAATPRAGSWMAPGAKKLDLLYVSDYETNDVYAYSYPAGKLSGVLRGVLRDAVMPAGLCADRAGDVFIPNSSNSTVLEYAHGGTKLVATLTDRNRLPYSCAVDPASGDLAVTNLVSASGAGDVAVYARARGTPKRYVYGFVYKYYFGAYDDRGNLFVSASDDVPSEPFALLELAKGAKALTGLTLDRGVAVPGGVAWDGKHVTLADPSASKIYRVAIEGSSVTTLGTTVLRRTRSLAQYAIANGRLAAASFRGANVALWRYPAGGAPLQTLGDLGEPFGVTFSFARK